MKKIMLAMISLLSLFLLNPLTVKSQVRITNSDNKSPNNAHELIFSTIYTKLNPTASTQDTTGWFNIEPYDEIAVMARSTDSGATGLTFQGKNSVFDNGVNYTTYTDTMALTDTTTSSMNSGQIKKFLIKTSTLNRVNQPANNQMRIIVDGITWGTTSGRYLYLYLIKKN